MLLFGAVDLAERRAPGADARAVRVHGRRGAARHPRRFRAGRDAASAGGVRRCREPTRSRSRRALRRVRCSRRPLRRRSARGSRRRANPQAFARAWSCTRYLDERGALRSGAPPADGTGGSGHRVMVVAGIGSKPAPTVRTLDLPVDDLGYRDDEVAYFSYAADGGAYDQRATPTRHARLGPPPRRAVARTATPRSRPRGRPARALARRRRRGRVPEALLRPGRSDVPTARQGRHLVVATRGRARRRRSPTRSAASPAARHCSRLDARRRRHGRSPTSTVPPSRTSPGLGVHGEARRGDGCPTAVELTTIGSTFDTTVPADHASTRRGARGTRSSTPDTSARTPGSCATRTHCAWRCAGARRTTVPCPSLASLRASFVPPAIALVPDTHGVFAHERLVVPDDDPHLRWIAAAVALVATGCSARHCRTHATCDAGAGEPRTRVARESRRRHRAPSPSTRTARRHARHREGRRGRPRRSAKCGARASRAWASTGRSSTDDLVVVAHHRAQVTATALRASRSTGSTGAELWQVEVGAGAVAVRRRRVATRSCARARAGHIVAVDRDGAPRWSQDVEAYLGDGRSRCRRAVRSRSTRVGPWSVSCSMWRGDGSARAGPRDRCRRRLLARPRAGRAAVARSPPTGAGTLRRRLVRGVTEPGRRSRSSIQVRRGCGDRRTADAFDPASIPLVDGRDRGRGRPRAAADRGRPRRDGAALAGRTGPTRARRPARARRAGRRRSSTGRAGVHAIPGSPTAAGPPPLDDAAGASPRWPIRPCAGGHRAARAGGNRLEGHIRLERQVRDG